MYAAEAEGSTGYVSTLGYVANVMHKERVNPHI
jgi:hypothetical protein